MEKSTYEKKQPHPTSAKATLVDMIRASPHNIRQQGKTLRCLDCLGTVSQNSQHVKLWLASSCSALLYDDHDRIVSIPSWHVIQIKNIIPHHTHTLMSYRGVIFCDKCGAYAVNRCRMFFSPCTQVCTVASQQARTKLRQHKLPTRSMHWPSRSGVRLLQPQVFDECVGNAPIAVGGVVHPNSFDDAEDFSLFDCEQ